MDHIEDVFLWNGDSHLFVAMIKSIEDRKNAAYDIEHGLVRVILLVEDSVDFYSLYLPIVYREIMEQTQRLIKEELNDNQKYNLMRTRPKVLLVKNYEDALALSKLYAPYLLSVISDIRFQRGGVSDHRAGIALIRQLKKDFFDVPMLLQSSDPAARKHAKRLGVDFIDKSSLHLTSELREFVLRNLGFGDFVFRNPDGDEMGRASSLSEIENTIQDMPIESVLYHAGRNHFSAWLVAHGEFQVARQIRPLVLSDFETKEDYRKFLVATFHDTRKNRNRGKIIEFDRSAVLAEDAVLRLREGSLGGKGRGLAFCNTLLVSTEKERVELNTTIQIPNTLIIATDEFDQFVLDNDILDSIENIEDDKIKSLLLGYQLSEYIEKMLGQYLEICKVPLAVRSSSLLEDSHTEPFAGIYGTYMIPNANPDLEVRKKELIAAIKLVYISVFLEETRRFIKSHGYRLDEEKMGVVIQELVGNRYNERFYPHISGVAQSYNYYPPQGISHSDPVASLAVGLGQTVVSSRKSFLYCPSHPQIPFLPQNELIKFTQTEFFALTIDDVRDTSDTLGDDDLVVSFPISGAESDCTLSHLASVFCEGNLEDGLFKKGPRVINFPDIVGYDLFPLNKILSEILSLLEEALGNPVEIEFAVNLSDVNNPAFYLLQVRPMTIAAHTEREAPNLTPETSIVYTENSLGDGMPKDLFDFIYLHPEQFDVTHTEMMRDELKEINIKMKQEGKRYILMAPGRWGSSDRFLGIPVSWSQIDQAGVIIEAAVSGMMVSPSQGSHFFHNLAAGGVGYLMVKENDSQSSVDLAALEKMPELGRGKYFRHIRLKKPFEIYMDGKSGKAFISEPEQGEV
jgi:nitrogen regulatory protein PII-like uncharacterized protein